MKIYVFFILLFLGRCQSASFQKKTYSPSKPVKHIIHDASLRNEPPIFIVESGDTIYNWPDDRPFFPNLREYIQKEIKGVDLGEGNVILSITISRMGVPYNPTIKKSARESGLVSSDVARKMDSIALDVGRRLPNFTPGSTNGKFVIARQLIDFQFE